MPVFQIITKFSTTWLKKGYFQVNFKGIFTRFFLFTNCFAKQLYIFILQSFYLFQLFGFILKMSDPSKSIAAKAEARRRKILENAQRRLNKVQELKGVISQSSSGKYVKTYVYTALVNCRCIIIYHQADFLECESRMRMS